jgi:hypothetical protein
MEDYKLREADGFGEIGKKRRGKKQPDLWFTSEVSMCVEDACVLLLVICATDACVLLLVICATC